MAQTKPKIKSLPPEAVVVSIGMYKNMKGPDKGLYSTFTMHTQGDRVVKIVNKQADIKVSSLDMLHGLIVETFVDPNF